VGSLGGCGATTIATHLAGDLGARAAAQGGSVLADLDLQFGTASDYLGLTPHSRLSDLLNADTRLDEDLIRSVATAAGAHLSVIAAHDTIVPLESIDTEQLHKVIALMRRQFGYAVLDLPSDWTNWSLSAATESSVIVIVVEQSLRSLRQARRRIELFRSVGITDGAMAIVVNRVKNGLFGTINVDDVAKALGHPVLTTVRLERPHICLAQDLGKLVGTIRKNSGFAGDIARLGDLLCAGVLAGAN
jgi:pilus assembly protein CpaE